MFSTPCMMPTTGYYGEWYSMPSKYSSILNRETTCPPNCQPCERTCQPNTGYPCLHERCGGPCPYTLYPSTCPGSYPCPSGTEGRNSWWTFNNNTLTSTNFRPGSEAEYYTFKNPIRCYENGCRGIWLCCDLHEYKPEEVNVTLNKTERSITIEATHDTKEHNVSRRYYRKFCLPEYMNKVDLGKVELRSYFGPDCYCYIEGVLPKLTPEETSNWPQSTAPYFAGLHWWRPMNTHPSWYNANWNPNCESRSWWPTTMENSKPVNCKVN